MDFLSRTKLLINETNLKKIINSKILVLGIGGVGSYAAEALVRSGISNLVIIDHAKIDITNINRQVIALNSTINFKKTETLKKRLQDINPNCKIKIINERIDNRNFNLILNEEPSFIIDACDSVITKKKLIKFYLANNIKFISVMGTGNKFDPTKFEISDIRNTTYDPIAKEIRKMINKEKIKGKIPVVFSPEKQIKTKEKNGSLSFVAPCAGLIAASYVINTIIKEN